MKARVTCGLQQSEDVVHPNVAFQVVLPLMNYKMHSLLSACHCKDLSDLLIWGDGKHSTVLGPAENQETLPSHKVL